MPRQRKIAIPKTRDISFNQANHDFKKIKNTTNGVAEALADEVKSYRNSIISQNKSNEHLSKVGHPELSFGEKQYFLLEQLRSKLNYILEKRLPFDPLNKKLVKEAGVTAFVNEILSFVADIDDSMLLHEYEVPKKLNIKLTNGWKFNVSGRVDCVLKSNIDGLIYLSVEMKRLSQILDTKALNQTVLECKSLDSNGILTNGETWCFLRRNKDGNYTQYRFNLISTNSSTRKFEVNMKGLKSIIRICLRPKSLKEKPRKMMLNTYVERIASTLKDKYEWFLSKGQYPKPNKGSKEDTSIGGDKLKKKNGIKKKQRSKNRC
eukprot:TRINITY_DN784_c0_g2_i1.p1 TRINITY_DN784_c0_g2~~TRINITY_DN784_c0_g2_i1.p1  ORF type:complete len:334 (-),score=49.91 TRINITY_DN784_c0_g2_i1:207-1166(-)